MIFAVIDDTPYRIVLLLHILTAMASIAPVFAHPFLSKQSETLDNENQKLLLGFMASNSARIYAPALVVTGLLGFALVGMSDSFFALSQGWLVAAFVVWIALNGVLHGALIPAERRWASGDSTAQSRVDALGGLMTMLMLIMLYLMIFKPGL